jgi:hypothetical protein
MRNAGQAVGPGDTSSRLMIVSLWDGVRLGDGPDGMRDALCGRLVGLLQMVGSVACCRLGSCLVGWVSSLSGFGSSGALDRGWEPGKVEGLL